MLTVNGLRGDVCIHVLGCFLRFCVSVRVVGSYCMLLLVVYDLLFFFVRVPRALLLGYLLLVRRRRL